MNTKSILPAFASACLCWLWTSSVSLSQEAIDQGVSESVLASVDAYFGNLRGNYIRLGASGSDDLVSTQFNNAVGVPSDQALTFEGGKRLLAGCRYHLCDVEKGAVLLDHSGNIIAVALIHTAFKQREPSREGRNSAREEEDAVEYDFDSPLLTIFVKNRPTTVDDRSILVGWAAEKLSNEPMITPAQRAENARRIRVDERIM